MGIFKRELSESDIRPSLLDTPTQRARAMNQPRKVRQLRRIFDAQSKMREARKKAERHEARANNIREKHLQEVLQEYPERRSTGGLTLAQLADDRAGKNPNWKREAEANRWQIDKAVMYGLEAQLETFLYTENLYE